MEQVSTFRTSEYTMQELDREARAAVKGRGRFLRWTVKLDTYQDGIPLTVTCLKVYYWSKSMEMEQATHVAI